VVSGEEWKTRELVHEHCRTPLEEDLGILVKVRNCIVHQLGEDADGSLLSVLTTNSRLGLSVAAIELLSATAAPTPRSALS